MCIDVRVILIATIAIVPFTVASPMRSAWPEEINFDKKVKFDEEIASIFQARCVKCHGSTKQHGGLPFDSARGAIRRGESGEMAIVPRAV